MVLEKARRMFKTEIKIPTSEIKAPHNFEFQFTHYVFYPEIREGEKWCWILGFDEDLKPLYTFPKPEAIAGTSLKALRACKVGYRDKFLKAIGEKTGQKV